MKTGVLSFLLAAGLCAGPGLWWRGMREQRAKAPAATPPSRAMQAISQHAAGTVEKEKSAAMKLPVFSEEPDLMDRLRVEEELAALPLERLPALCEEALALPDDEEREAMLEGLLRRWAVEDGRAAMTWGRDHLYEKDEWEVCFATIGTTWAAYDSAGLEKWFRSLAGQEQWAPEGQGLSTTVMGWLAPSDIVAAARVGMSETGHDQQTISNLLRAHIHTADQARAIAAMVESQMPPPPRRMTGEGRTYFEQQQGDGYERAQVLKALEDRWPKVDPEGWAQWMERHPDSVTGFPHALVAAGKICEDSPGAAAANAAVAAAPADLRTETAALVVERWALNDPVAAGQWLRARGITGAADVPVVAAYARGAAGTDAAAALEWLSSIPEPAGREVFTLTHFRHWQERQPEAAAAFLRTAGWPEERMERLRLLGIFDDR